MDFLKFRVLARENEFIRPPRFSERFFSGVYVLQDPVQGNNLRGLIHFPGHNQE